MPLPLISSHPHRFARSPTRKRFFSPGGHSHDRHTIPPDQLHVSLSDPVLVAAEQHLSDQIRNKDGGARTDEHGSLMFHIDHIFLSQNSGGDCVFDAPQAVNDPTVVTNQPSTFDPRSQEIGLFDPLDDNDISEVVTVPDGIDNSPSDNLCSASKISREGPNLDPLASETFKQELYTRGYLKRPASRPSSLVPRKPRFSLVFGNRSILPKLLGRRHVIHCPKAEQDAADGLDTHLSETLLLTSGGATLRTPHAENLDSTWAETNTSVSDSLDLHEFSYLTAFTTPPSSPSVLTDGETSKKGVDLGDSKHAV